MTQAADAFRAAAEGLAAEMESVIIRLTRLLNRLEDAGTDASPVRDSLVDMRRHVEQAMTGVERVVSDFSTLTARLTDLEDRYRPT